MLQSPPSRWMVLTLSIFLILSLLQSSSTTSVVLANERATSDMLKEDRNYVRFSKIAYYPYSPNLLQFNDTDIEGQLPSSCASSWTMDHVLTLYIPKHEINIQAKYFINDCKTELVVSFRGSETKATKGALYNWQTNLEMIRVDCTYSDNCGGIHHGFDEYYKSIQTTHLQYLNNILKNHTTITQLTFTGHSLGGALASVAALDTRFRLQIAKTLPEIKTADAISIKIRTFGSPRVGNSKFVAAFNKYVPQSRRYVSEYGTSNNSEEDFVTGQPPSLLGYSHVNQKFTVKCGASDPFMCHKLMYYWGTMDPLYDSLKSYLDQFSEAVSDDMTSDSSSSFAKLSARVMATIVIVVSFVVTCL